MTLKYNYQVRHAGVQISIKYDKLKKKEVRHAVGDDACQTI